MEVLARKKGGIGFLYWILFVFSCLVLLCGILSGEGMVIICGLLFFLCCGVILIKLIATPKEIISKTSSGTLVLHFCNQTISPMQLKDISYRRASARGIQYKWGRIIITTDSGKYQCDFVAEVEEVAKELTRLMYENKAYE